MLRTSTNLCTLKYDVEVRRRLLVILPDVLCNVLKGLVCRWLFLDYTLVHSVFLTMMLTIDDNEVKPEAVHTFGIYRMTEETSENLSHNTVR